MVERYLRIGWGWGQGGQCRRTLGLATPFGRGPTAGYSGLEHASRAYGAAYVPGVQCRPGHVGAPVTGSRLQMQQAPGHTAECRIRVAHDYLSVVSPGAVRVPAEGSSHTNITAGKGPEL